MSKICPVSKLPVHILLIFPGVLNSYHIQRAPAYDTMSASVF